jgi:hypothetical protein
MNALRRAPFAWPPVLTIGAAELFVLVAFGNGYGYHRDELYFRVAARRPAFGYPDQPLLPPLLGRLSESLFGESPRGLRVVSAVAMDMIETFGWPELADAVERVAQRLPPAERRRAVVFTDSYGEAGALARYGPDRGLPPCTRATTASPTGAHRRTAPRR